MSITYTAFSPSPDAPFSWNPILDGQTYIATVKWGLFGKRWYLQITTLQGVLVLYKALIASPQNFGINLLFGYFTTTMVFRDSTQQFEVSS